jgi:hypothetical protein
MSDNTHQLTLGFYDDKELRGLPETEVINLILGKLPRHETEVMPAAMASIALALKSSAQLGQLLEEIHNRHKGTSWTEVFTKLNLGISQSTADRYRQQWINRNRVFFTEDHTPLVLTKAYQHAELLPQPEPTAKPDLPPPPFKLNFSFSDKPVAEWGREYVVDFLTRTEKVEKLRTEAKAFILKQ